jgi:TfoX/Sxy family transcriptional regulator of competence genes
MSARSNELAGNLFAKGNSMKFKKTPKELFDFVDSALTDYGCESRKMFGGIAYFVQGNMFTGAHQRDLFLRLSESDRKQLMKEHDEVTPFEPMPGRRMSEYVAIPESVFSQPTMLKPWLDKSFKYASLLPRKEKKGSKKKSSL